MAVAAIPGDIAHIPILFKESMVNLTVHNKKQAYDCRFKILSGNAVLGNHKFAGGNLEFDLNTMMITNISDQKIRDSIVKLLKSDKFFNVAKYPKAELQFMGSTFLRDATEGADNYAVNANLTLAGLTDNVSFTIFADINDNMVNLKCNFGFDRTKWKITYMSSRFNDDLGNREIFDIIDVKCILAFNK